MGSRVSAGLVFYRFRSLPEPEVFLVHPGGPFFAKRDEGCWTIPKGEVEPGDDLLATACREFTEETGLAVPVGVPFLELGNIRQKGGKLVHAWGVAGDLPANFELRSNLFTMEWPPGSGVTREFPEADRGEFFGWAEAQRKIKPAQWPLIEELARQLSRLR